MKLTDLPPNVRKQVAAKLPAKPKKQRGMNKSEKEFNARLLNDYPNASIYYEGITLKLGHDCRYTPDFFVVDYADTNDGFDPWAIYAFEVKGFRRDDAMVKIRVAARMYPWISFFLVEREKGGAWKITEVPR